MKELYKNGNNNCCDLEDTSAYKIEDTLECVKRHMVGTTQPLTMKRDQFEEKSSHFSAPTACVPNTSEFYVYFSSLHTISLLS